MAAPSAHLRSPQLSDVSTDTGHIRHTRTIVSLSSLFSAIPLYCLSTRAPYGAFCPLAPLGERPGRGRHRAKEPGSAVRPGARAGINRRRRVGRGAGASNVARHEPGATKQAIRENRKTTMLQCGPGARAAYTSGYQCGPARAGSDLRAIRVSPLASMWPSTSAGSDQQAIRLKS